MPIGCTSDLFVTWTAPLQLCMWVVELYKCYMPLSPLITLGHEIMSTYSSLHGARKWVIIMTNVFEQERWYADTRQTKDESTEVNLTQPGVISATEFLIDWLGFNGTFRTNRLYRAFEKYVAVKMCELMRKLTKLCVGNTHNKALQ